MLPNLLIEHIKVDLNSLVINYERKNAIIGIYKITSPTGKIYVGQAIDIENRFCKDYKKIKCKNQRYLYHSLKKQGVENHIFELIHIIDSNNLTKTEIHNQLNILETYYVSLFNSFIDDNPNGMNLTRGGDCCEISKETKMKISKTLTGRKASEEARKNQSKSIEKRGGVWNKGKCGEQHNRFGVKLTPEHIAKIVSKNKGKKQNPEHTAKSIETRKRNKEYKILIDKQYKKDNGIIEPVKEKYVPTIETRQKQSKSRLGKKLSPDSLSKRTETNKNKTQAQKDSEIKKMLETKRNKTQSERDASIEKQKESWKNKTKIEKDAIRKKMNTTNNNKTQKQKDVTISKRNESRIATMKIKKQLKEILSNQVLIEV